MCIVSNGSIKNGRLTELLCNTSTTLQVSLDGATEEQNARTRGAGNFKRALDFVSRIHNDRQKPLLKMVISKNNLDGVEAFYRLALSAGCIPEFAFIYKSGNGSDGWNDKALSQREKMDALNIIDRLNRETKTDALVPECTIKCPFTHNTDNMSVCIKTDGSIQPCQGLYSSQFTLGNIFSFDEAAFLSRLDEICEIARARLYRDYGCERCVIEGMCGRGCMAEAFHLYEDPLENDGNCELRKMQFFKSLIKEQHIGVKADG